MTQLGGLIRARRKGGLLGGGQDPRSVGAFRAVPDAGSGAPRLSEQAQKKSATEEAEKEKKEEINALQGQVAALKEMQTDAQADKVSRVIQDKAHHPQPAWVSPDVALQHICGLSA